MFAVTGCSCKIDFATVNERSKLLRAKTMWIFHTSQQRIRSATDDGFDKTKPEEYRTGQGEAFAEPNLGGAKLRQRPTVRARGTMCSYVHKVSENTVLDLL